MYKIRWNFYLKVVEIYSQKGGSYREYIFWINCLLTPRFLVCKIAKKFYLKTPAIRWIRNTWKEGIWPKQFMVKPLENRG